MAYMKPALAAAILMTSFACAHAWAQQSSPQAEPPGAPAQQVEPAASARPQGADGGQAPQKKPLRRRSVQQVIGSMPPAAPVAPEAYRPTLQPRLAPGAAAPPAVGLAPASPSGPVRINRCAAGGCIDIDGARYNGGIGNAVIDGKGRLCTRTGTTLQCF
jgi:hypothetical protein